MQNSKGRSSIQRRLRHISMAVIFFITMLFILFCLILFQHILRDNLIQYTQLNLALLSENISKEMINLEFMARECASSKPVIQYFESRKDHTSPEYSEAYASFFLEYSECASHQYINQVILCDFDDTSNYMQITGQHSEVLNDPIDHIRQDENFKAFRRNPLQPLISVSASPFDNAVTEKVISIIYPIGVGLNTPPDAFIYIEVSPRVITDYIGNYNIAEDCEIFITTGDTTYRINEDIFTVDAQTSYTNQKILSQEVTFSDWSISQTVTRTQIAEQAKFYFSLSLAVIILVIIFGIVYSAYLNRLIAVPVYKLRRRIIAISYGHFEFDKEIEWPDEFGDIGRGINTMSQHISELMDKRMADQKTKSDLEYQMLLNQMTPHFVYNTLNTIRWMAQIQNASGISEMTSALARLMKNISKLPDTHIPVSKEFELIDDYFTIIRLRYGSAITLNYNIIDPTIIHCEIVKFTLQPLVENAIFHGIEPKHQTGTITITADRIENNKYYIEIADDGIGIDPEKIPELLAEDITHESDGLMKHMGLYNVNKRLQYDFGPEYGLTIKSELGKYTKITVTIPYSERGELHVETSDR